MFFNFVYNAPASAVSWEQICTLLVGALTLVVALRQWFISRRQFRLSLFERRYKVYEADSIFLSYYETRKPVTFEDLSAFDEGVCDVIFLYPADIQKWVTDVRMAVVVASPIFEEDQILLIKERCIQQARTEMSAAEYPDWLDSREAWLYDQREKVMDTFKPYLDFTRL